MVDTSNLRVECLLNHGTEHPKQELTIMYLLQGESKVNSAAWASCCVQVTMLTSALATY